MVGSIVVVPSYPPEWSCSLDVALPFQVTKKLTGQ